MKTYDEFRKQAQDVWEQDDGGNWVEYQYGDNSNDSSGDFFSNYIQNVRSRGKNPATEMRSSLLDSDRDWSSMLTSALPAADSGGPGEYGEDPINWDGELSEDPEFETGFWEGQEEIKPDDPELAWEEPQQPVQRAVGTGPIRSVAATNVKGKDVNKMLADAEANAKNPMTANGRRNGRNQIGSPYVTRAGMRPGNRAPLNTPANAQAATTPSAPPTNPASANPTNPTTDSRGLTPGATTGKVETTKATTGPNMTTYKDAYAKTKTPTLGTTKTAGLFGGKKDKPKPKEKVISGPGIESWDPDYKEGIPQNYQFDYQPMNDAIYNELNKHYIKLLLDAYRRSTGKELKDPEKQLKVRYGYALGRAPNVNPDIVAQLKPEDQKWLTGWDSDIHNVTPGVVADAVDHLNNGGKYVPLMWENGDEPKRTPKPLKLSV